MKNIAREIPWILLLCGTCSIMVILFATNHQEKWMAMWVALISYGLVVLFLAVVGLKCLWQRRI